MMHIVILSSELIPSEGYWNPSWQMMTEVTVCQVPGKRTHCPAYKMHRSPPIFVHKAYIFALLFSAMSMTAAEGTLGGRGGIPWALWLAPTSGRVVPTSWVNIVSDRVHVCVRAKDLPASVPIMSLGTSISFSSSRQSRESSDHTHVCPLPFHEVT